jgi:hypothetical protein
MNISELTQAVPSLSDADIATLQGAVHQELVNRIALRDKSLPEDVFVVAIQGQADQVQVPRLKAIELLNAGTHKLATS